MGRLEKNPSIWQAWMEHHADYAKIYNEHYERNGSFKTTSKTHDDGDDEDLDGDKPRRGRTVNKAPDISVFGGLALDDQALVETQVKLVAAVRKMRKYMRTNTDDLKEKYATVIELLRKDQARLIVAAENPDEFKKLFDNYLENGVVGDPRKLFIDSERNEQAYAVIKNLKGGQKM